MSRKLLKLRYVYIHRQRRKKKNKVGVKYFLMILLEID